jgi:outer membrane protein TolC
VRNRNLYTNSYKRSVRRKIHLNKFLFISIYFNLYLSISLFSQPDSLSSYLELAAKNNPTVLQKFSEYKAALQKIPQAGSLPDPELTAGVLVQRMMLVMGYQIADIKLMQMFPWFGMLKYAKDEVSQMAKAKFETYIEAVNQAGFDTRTNWYELYRLGQSLKISGRNLELLKTIERIAIVNYRAGVPGRSGRQASVPSSGQNRMQQQGAVAGTQSMEAMGNTSPISPSASPGTESRMEESSMGAASGATGLTDIYRIQIGISNLQNEIELIHDQQRSATARFNSILNRPPLTPVAIPDTLIVDTLVMNMDLNSVSDSILENNPALAMIKYEKSSIESRAKMVRRMGYPMLGIGVDYTIMSKFGAVSFPMNGADMVMPMVSITLPVYRKKYRSMQEETGQLKTAKEEEYEAGVNNLQSEYFQAMELYRDARRRISFYSGQFLLAKKSLDIIIKSYSVGSAGLIDILFLQQQSHDYELKKAEAVTDFNTALAWLNRLMMRPLV